MSILSEQAKIAIRGLCKDFPRRNGTPLRVLHDIDLEVHHREFAVLLGPSGCGKTTLLRTIAGLEPPDSGEVLVDGCAVTGPDKKRGMVFQAYTSFPWLTVFENVLFGLRLTDRSRSEQEVIARDQLRQVGLEGFEDQYPSQLSGGMKQRVALARTLAVKPDVLLLDEPFGALDSQTRSLMQELLMDIWDRDHKTVLFVTHDIEEAIFLADRVYVCSARPATIRDRITVDFKRPRRFGLRTEAGFNDLKLQLLQFLRDDIIRFAKDS